MGESSFAQAFLSKKSLFEIVGTIVLLATLFSSVGLSTWGYGANLLPNPNFTDNSTGWTVWDAVWNESGYMTVFQDASFFVPEGAVMCYKDSYYYVSFFFRMTNASDMSWFRLTYVGQVYLDIYLNSTHVINNSAGEYLLWNTVSIIPKSDNWYKFEGIFDTSVLSANRWCEVYFDGEGMSGLIDIDNVVVMNATCDQQNCGMLNLSIGLSEPADGTRSMSSPIDFSYAVLSNYDILNCSLVTNTNGWSIKQTNSTPVAEGGTLNYFSLSGMATKDTFVWTVACTTAYAPNVQYLGGNRTYIYDPMYAGDVATNILRYAPILLGLFILMMTFVWVMTRESEEFLSVMIQMAVLYLVLAVMLTIIFSILG